MGAHGTTTAGRARRAHDDPSYDPAAEVVELCRDLIRIDTTNYGDDYGPGERKAAEHVAGLLDEVGIEPELYERRAGARRRSWRTGAIRRPSDRAAAARPPRRRTRRRGGLAGRPVLRRDPGRLRLGPRRGRHEGLRRDDALGGPRARPRAGRAARRGRSCSASPPTRRRAAATARSSLVEQHPDVVRGLHRGGSARSAASPPPCAGSGSTWSRRPRRAWPGCG